MITVLRVICFLFSDTATPAIYTLSLHDALPIFTADRYHEGRLDWFSFQVDPNAAPLSNNAPASVATPPEVPPRSEEHTSELQSRRDLVCRLLLEKKKTMIRVTWPKNGKISLVAP